MFPALFQSYLILITLQVELLSPLQSEDGLKVIADRARTNECHASGRIPKWQGQLL